MADISVIKLPSGNEYNIKDTVARQAIAGGIAFNIVWKQGDYESTTAPTTTQLAGIPQGVTVYYNNGASSATGTLVATKETTGFYLIYSKTHTSEGALDKYDEYVAVTTGTELDYSWEKLGDTQIDLSGVVTDVTLNKQTTNFVTGLGTPSTKSVIGARSLLAATGPSVTLSTGATAGTGVISVATDASGTSTYLGATASGTGVAWNSKDSVTAVTGVSATKTNVKATASGANVAWNSKDQVTAVTEVTAIKKYLNTSQVIGVQRSTTTASKATAGTSQTTATGGGTTSTTNTDWLKGVSVTNEVLTIGAATLNTQSTPQYTFSDVTVPIKATSGTRVATGELVDIPVSDEAEIVTGVSASGTDTVIGTNSTFTVTQPTIALATGATAGTGVVSLATDATASSTDTVIGTDSTFTVTQPTVTLASNSSSATGRVSVVTGVSATKTNVKASTTPVKVTWEEKDPVTVVTGLGTPTTAAGLNNNTTITVTKGS